VQEPITKMPTYVYECSDCKEKFEITGSFSTLINMILNCPKCKGKNIKKKFFPFGIVFKTSGFYSTDKRTGKNE
jgi:putative FmdB family regulatory protein